MISSCVLLQNLVRKMQPPVQQQPGWGAHRDLLKGRSAPKPAPTTYRENYCEQKMQQTGAAQPEPLMKQLLARDRIPLPNRTGSFETDSFRRSFSAAELRWAKGSAVHASSRDRYQDMNWVRYFPKLRERVYNNADKQLDRYMDRHVAHPTPSRSAASFVIGPPGSQGINWEAFANSKHAAKAGRRKAGS